MQAGYTTHMYITAMYITAMQIASNFTTLTKQCMHDR